MKPKFLMISQKPVTRLSIRRWN